MDRVAFAYPIQRGCKRQILAFSLLAAAILSHFWVTLAHASLIETPLNESRPYAKIAKCESGLTRELTRREASSVIGDGPDNLKVRRALDFLKTVPHPTQTQLAILFESLAREIIYQSGDGWTCYRFHGLAGEIGYRGGGIGAYALVITHEGKLKVGVIPDESFLPNHYWSGLESLTPLN